MVLEFFWEFFSFKTFFFSKNGLKIFLPIVAQDFFCFQSLGFTRNTSREILLEKIFCSARNFSRYEIFFARNFIRLEILLHKKFCSARNFTHYEIFLQEILFDKKFFLLSNFFCKKFYLARNFTQLKILFNKKFYL